MKMTPEQKAFFEYGGAWETTVVIHTFIRSLLKDKGYQLSPELLHHYRDEKSHYGAVLREAWKWRRKCRAWTIPSQERICENCDHGGTHPYATPCSECFRCPFAQAYEGFSDNWEPRKEGE